jgi:hypothetical protein
MKFMGPGNVHLGQALQVIVMKISYESHFRQPWLS